MLEVILDTETTGLSPSQNNRIVEIGGGYGGLCKTISCLCDFEEYHIYDIEPAAKLQEKYLSKFDITGKIINHSTIEKLEDIDLVVSNYAYSELNEELQSSYYENIISIPYKYSFF